MSINISLYHIAKVKITGQMTKDDQITMGQVGNRTFQHINKIRALITFENFQGWDKGNHWNDSSFQISGDEHIEKMAIVCEPQWQDDISLFTGCGLRSFPIEFFKTESEALSWLNV